MAVKLTGKQQHFARAVASGTMTQSAAYREAYSASNMSSASVRVEASRLLADPNMSLTVKALKAANEVAIQAQSLSDRDRVLESLRKWMTSAEPMDSNKLRAAELLGKSVGMFKEVTETVSIDRDAESISMELERRLGSLLVTSPETEPKVLDSESESFH
tara:strand:- start:11 stop:490 length:480 start_codon:yes stop_codon:yes gene_type:complete